MEKLNMKIGIFLLLGLFFSNPLLAQELNQTREMNTKSNEKILGQQVFVSGMKDPDWKSYQAFFAGMNVYEKLKKLAPDAPLLFVLRAQRPNISMEGISIRIAGESTFASISVANNGVFSIPLITEALQDKAELVLNQKAGLFRWRPYINSLGVAENTRRLGDLRLECAVRWAIEQDELPILMKKVFNAYGGPCNSRQIQVDFLTPQKVFGIEMVDGNKKKFFKQEWIESNGQIYFPPLYDQSWSDDTLLIFTFI